MIQRKQTVFLLLALAAVIVCLCLPLGQINYGGRASSMAVWYNLGLYSSFGITVRPILFVDLVVVGTLTLIDIFLYNRRRLQMMFCTCNIILCLVWYAYYAYRVWAFGSVGTYSFKFAACLPLIAIVLFWLARRGIKADEELIKSMDRIR